MPTPPPFVWFTVHGQISGGRAGPPPGPTSPRCLLLGENKGSEDRWGHPEESAGAHPRFPTSLDANGRARRWIRTSRIRPYPIAHIVERVFGEGYDVHYTEQEARADALSFTLDEIEPNPSVVSGPPLPGMPPVKRAKRLHLWLRDGLAWCNPWEGTAHPAFPTLDALADHPLYDLAQRWHGQDLPPQTPFGLLLLDHTSSGQPSAHHVIETERRAAEDLRLAHGWSAAQGHPLYTPLLVRT